MIKAVYRLSLEPVIVYRASTLDDVEYMIFIGVERRIIFSVSLVQLT